MRCTVSPSAFGAGLTLVSRAVSPRSTLPVLSNILLETAASGLRMTATNLDLTISALVPAEVFDEGRTTVPSRLLTEYVTSLGDAPCTLELEPASQVTQIRCGAQRARLHGIDAVEFPPLPIREEGREVEIDSAQLARGIGQTVMAASADEASPVLTGILLRLEGDQATLVATDRHRLAVRRLPLRGRVDGEAAQVIVPSRHLGEVARAVTPARPVVRLSLARGRNQAFLAVGDVEISTRLLEGTYPNYAQVIPAESRTRVVLPAEVLLRAARTAAVLARDAGNPVRLQVRELELTLLAQTAEVGEHRAPVEARVTGEELEIAFNARYLIEAVSAVEGEDVDLAFNGPLQPGVIRGAGRDDYLCVVMPVRIP